MILMYHNVADDTCFNTVSVSDFRKHLVFLKNHYKIVDLETYISDLSISKKIATVTFDDAYTSILTNILPIIEELEIPTTVFVPTAYVGNYNLWDKNHPDFHKIEILSWNQIQNLDRNPLITFGSHGVNHKSLHKLNYDDSLSELADSKRIIEQNLGHKVDYFAFPFGQQCDLGNYHNEILQKTGYSAALTTLWKRDNCGISPFELRRVEVLHCDDIDSFRKKLTRKIDFKYAKQLIKNIL